MANHPAVQTPELNRQRLLRLPAVLELTGLKRANLYTLVTAGRFPRQRKIGKAMIVWPRAEIEAWITEIEKGNTPTYGNTKGAV